MSPCWTVNVNGKPRWKDHTSVAIGDKMYFFRSYNNEENLTTIGPGDVQVFQTDTYHWSVLKDQNFSEINNILPPYLVDWQFAVVYGDLVYLWAVINSEDQDVLFCFDTNSHLWSKPIVSGIIMPDISQRTGYSNCIINDSMYMFGGFDENLGLYSQDVYKFDMKFFIWSQVSTKGEPPIHREGHSATAINSCMFIYGGCGSGGPHYSDRIISFGDVIYLDTQTMTWIRHEVIGFHPLGRTDHSAVCYKGQLLFFGGLNSDREEIYSSDLWRYDLNSRCWSLVETRGNGPCPRYGHSSFLIKDRVFIFGGFPSPWPVSDVSLPDYFNDIHALDFDPSLRTLSIVAVLEHQLDQNDLPETVRSDIKFIKSEEIQSGNNVE